jgi:hypothetical protein
MTSAGESRRLLYGRVQRLVCTSQIIAACNITAWLLHLGANARRVARVDIDTSRYACAVVVLRQYIYTPL